MHKMCKKKINVHFMKRDVFRLKTLRKYLFSIFLNEVFTVLLQKSSIWNGMFDFFYHQRTDKKYKLMFLFIPLE